MTITDTAADWKPGALAAEKLLDRALLNAVDVDLDALTEIARDYRLAADCRVRGDYVGAWIAYGRGFLRVEDAQVYSLLKKDENGQIV